MATEQFTVKSDPELWGRLNMDVERFKNMPPMLTQAYTNIFLSQKNRPRGMAYFNDCVANIHTGRIDELMAAKDAGKPVVGTFCVYVPEELVVAAGGVCVGLCGGAQGSIADAEKILPRNICPMVKSAFGFKVGRICPYFQAVDFVYGETTCDAKKKTWELLDEYVPTHVMEIPQKKGPPGERRSAALEVLRREMAGMTRDELLAELAKVRERLAPSDRDSEAAKLWEALAVVAGQAREASAVAASETGGAGVGILLREILGPEWKEESAGSADVRARLGLVIRRIVDTLTRCDEALRRLNLDLRTHMMLEGRSGHGPMPSG